MFFLCLVATANVLGRRLTIATWPIAKPLLVSPPLATISHVVGTVDAGFAGMAAAAVVVVVVVFTVFIIVEIFIVPLLVVVSVTVGVTFDFILFSSSSFYFIGLPQLEARSSIYMRSNVCT